jgi:hypothetical protein
MDIDMSLLQQAPSNELWGLVKEEDIDEFCLQGDLSIGYVYHLSLEKELETC